MPTPEVRAPGLKWRARADGQRTPYWVARADIVRKGYRPKTVRLIYDHDDPKAAALLEHRCRVLQAEMLEWSTGRKGQVQFDGTLRSLVTRYETDPDSPYRDLQPSTQQTYSKHLRILIASVGERRVDAVTGADVRRWFKKMGGGGYAYLTVSILKAVVSYGASLGAELVSPNPCTGLRAQMTAARFTQPPARDTRLSYEQLCAFRPAAHALGRPSMARGVTLQYECALRQRDVIGVTHDGRWSKGLTWTHIGPDGVLRKETTKTAAPAEHRIADYPDLCAELALVPLERRVGPIVINERTGLPYTPEQYRKAFREIARKAGIPDSVWNMDARAGAVTEAYESGAELTDAMALATHTTPSISRRYNRTHVKQSSRAAKLRVANRSST